jgi:hypothetical protein
LPEVAAVTTARVVRGELAEGTPDPKEARLKTV